MKKLIISLAVAVLVLGIYLSYLEVPLKTKLTTLEPNMFKIDYNDNLVHKRIIYELINNLSYQVAQSHEYKLHRFDCTDFSKELVAKLKEKGLNAYCVFGTLKYADYPLHTWVEIKINEVNYIWVESTTGEIIYNRENYKLLRKTKICI